MPDARALDARGDHWRVVLDILRLLPGAEVWAFGSRAKGTAKPHSDLDLAVVGVQPMSLDAAAQLREAFSDPICRGASISWIGR